MTRLLPGLTLAWYLALVGLVGSHRSAELQSPPSLAMPPVEAPIQLAVDVLSQATALKSAAVGFAGSTPTEVLAWRLLVEAPFADSLFLRVLSQSQRPAGKLWALAGLRVVAPQVFEREAVTLEAGRIEVQTIVGCSLGTRPVRVVIRELRRFHWVREYLGGPRAAA